MRTDVGKVLGVTQDAEENPVYGLIESGGSNDFVVTFSGSPGNASCDKTFSDILAAYSAGMNIRGIIPFEVYRVFANCVVVRDGQSVVRFQFAAPYMIDDKPMLEYIVGNVESNAVSMHSASIV